jgi:flagellar protein FliO/FliZ
MFEALFGSELPLALRFFIAFLFVLGLIGGAAYLVRRFGAGALNSAAGRGRQPRLGVIESAAVDGRRRLVIIRRDNVEHLVMIGGPSDVVVETNIVRATPAATAREVAPMRAAPEPMVRPAPASEAAMWPLQPEPLGRPQRQPIEETAWPAATPEVPVRGIDRPAPAYAAEPPRGGGEYVNARASADFAAARPDVAAVRPPQEGRRPAPVAAPAPPPTPSPSDEQNLAEMAHRLEAALRRPPAAAPAGEAAMIKPVSEPMTRPATPDLAPAGRHTAADAPRPAPEPKSAMVEPKVLEVRPPEPKPAEPKPQAGKSVYDSLEQEMASLLGRPSGKP